ncbi:MAG: glycerophosphodiester phosphodiesterase family protein [Ginsengibacter sp.]
MKQLIAAVFLFVFAMQADAQNATTPLSKHDFIVIAHRGDHVDVPENTIAAFENAIKHGVDYVEIDLRTTKDSILVIMHDASVDRMTNGKGAVRDLTYGEIKKFKIAGKGKDSAKTYDVPTFEEVLKTCKDRIHIYLDFKNAGVRQCYNMIRQYGMEHQVIVYINSSSQYQEWRRLAPSMPVMLSLPGNLKNADELKTFLDTYPLELLDGDYSDYTPDMVTYANKESKKVWPDIQSNGEAANWDKAIETGFRGLQTDHPEALIRYLQKKGLR